MYEGFNIEDLLEKYLENRCNPEEQELVERHLVRFMDRNTLKLSPQFIRDSKDETIRLLLGEIHRKDTALPGRIFHVKQWYYSVAAGILLAIVVSLYWYPSFFVHPKSKQVNQEISPGYNQATLTLSNGTKIILDSAKSGIQVGGKDFHYNDGTKIETKDVVSSAALNEQYAILATPRGGQYQVILNDGTKVWLNAASTLRYPREFGNDKRTVELDGEAYFIISDELKKANRSFTVKTKGQEIQVLGTTFNISCFSDEKQAVTTLVSGNVQVTVAGSQKSLILLPGEQAITHGNDISKHQVDPFYATAWKDGLIAFRKEPLENIMDKVMRWYNVTVRYEGGIEKHSFSGVVSRYENISKLLATLSKTGEINYQIEEGVIKLSPGK
ncbi:FecR family protein [bacterium A37T11]|nr:FecR family protein [bacterium A37T11]